MKLCERITDRALVVGDMAHSRPGRLKDEEVKEDFKSSGVVLRMEMMTTVTDLLAASKKMEGLYLGVFTGSTINVIGYFSQ